MYVFDSSETCECSPSPATHLRSILAEFCLPLVRVGGCFVAAKGADGEAEVRDSLSLLPSAFHAPLAITLC
jgi:hypothetical protein